MVENNIWAMIMLCTINYAFWTQRIEDIIFHKYLYDPLENNRVKPAAPEDEE